MFNAAQSSSPFVKVFPLKLKPGKQAEAERVVLQYAPLGPEKEPGTLSFRVYRDPANVDYLLFVEHFADQGAYDAHTGSPVYRDVVVASLAPLIAEWKEINHELIVSKQ
jgi:quinol monooxygenase YgiN